MLDGTATVRARVPGVDHPRPVGVDVADVDGHGLLHVERTVACVCDGDTVIVRFDAELWVWDARRADTWTFVSLPVETSEEIRDLAGPSPRGFGAVRVRATVGATTWTTSVFPDRARGCYVLPVKRSVRTAEGLEAGDRATFTVELVNL